MEGLKKTIGVLQLSPQSSGERAWWRPVLGGSSTGAGGGSTSRRKQDPWKHRRSVKEGVKLQNAEQEEREWWQYRGSSCDKHAVLLLNSLFCGTLLRLTRRWTVGDRRGRKANMPGSRRNAEGRRVAAAAGRAAPVPAGGVEHQPWRAQRRPAGCGGRLRALGSLWPRCGCFHW